MKKERAPKPSMKQMEQVKAAETPAPHEDSLGRKRISFTRTCISLISTL